MNIDFGDIGLSTIRKITDLWAGAKSDSLIDYTKVSRVEPIVLIDSACMYSDALPEVMQSLQSIFAGYYLQAIAISTTIGKIDVTRHLDKLNPSRSAADSAANTMGWLMAQESYTHRLPTPQSAIAMEAPSYHPHANNENVETTLTTRQVDQMILDAAAQDRDKTNAAIRGAETGARKLDLDRRKFATDTAFREAQAATTARQWQQDYTSKLVANGLKQEEVRNKVMDLNRKYAMDVEKFGHEKAMDNLRNKLESEGMEIRHAELDLRRQEREDALSASEMSIGRDTLATIKELSNLSVGKLLSVEITDGLHKASVPIAIRLMANSVPTANLVHILSVGNQDTSVKERYHGWKAGRLNFIRDLVLCQDLIDAHYKDLASDPNGILTNIMKRNRGNQLSTLVSGNPSVATASNLVVMSSETVAQLELKLNGKLSDFKTRQKVFKETYMMIMVVIDSHWDRVTFYHRGIHTHTEMGVRDLKTANKGNGPDVSDILKAYQFGNSPSL